MTKPTPPFFAKLIEVSGHSPDETAYVGDRLDNDIAPAAAAGLFTVWIRRGPWGYILQPGDPAAPNRLGEVIPDLYLESLADLIQNLTSRRWMAKDFD